MLKSHIFNTVFYTVYTPLQVTPMETKTHQQQLHIFFLPFMGQGHTLPLIDIAKLFASRGEKSTIITTPANAPLFTKAIQTSKSSGLQIEILLIKFPSTEVGLPEGFESSNDWGKSAETAEKFFKALSLLEHQVEQLLNQYRPHCIVASSLFHWTTDLAAKFGIPRLIFQGPGFFSLCAARSVTLYQPHMKVASDSEYFTVPNLPHEIKMTRNELPSFLKQDGEPTELMKLLNKCRETEQRSYGIIMNSFYELEPDYADHYRNVFKRKSWHIGPVSLCNTAENDKLARGREGSSAECLNWLNSNEPNSVVYVCFGTLTNFSDSQLIEIALGLEASQQQFIWVVKKEKNDKEESFLPEGFEERVKGRGLIIRGWAPQLLILQHEAVGAFLTHCGWNSILEGVTAGVPMITWPLFADQFYNEKLVTEILGIGVPVGSKKSEDGGVKSEARVKREAIRKAVSEIMEGDEAEEIRRRAGALGEVARSAVEEGGSSYSDLTALIGELRSFGS